MKIELQRQNKSKFTRMCIGEAIIILMKTTEYEKLKVSAIVKKAGVSRMSYYRYYETPREALEDYLKILVEEYIQASRAVQERTTWFEYGHILFSLRFFICKSSPKR